MQIYKHRTEDLMLWQNFLAGDEQAYVSIYEKYVQNLYSFGMAFTTDREMVKDCIQEVFIRIYKNRNHLGQTDNVKFYLLAALKNTLFNEFKKQNAVKQVIASIEESEFDATIEDKIISFENEATLQERITGLKSILTSRQQEIIHYRFVEDMKIEDISKILGINYQSVANIIQRSLKKMRNFYLKSEYKN